MRKLGLDYGDARIGIAITDRDATIASPYAVYRTRGWKRDIEYLAELIRAQEVGLVVLGDPLNMDGTAGERSRIVHEFGARLAAASGVGVVYMDERLTTAEMHAFLDTQHVSRQKRAEAIDKLSAQLILKNHLEAEETRQARAGREKE